MTTWQREIAQARSVGDILVEEEALSKTDLERAKALADERDKCVEEILHEEKMVTEEMLQRAIADHYRVPTEEQFSLSIFTADGFARMVKPVLRMLFGEKKANFCAFKLSCRAERRHRKVLQKQALLEAKIAEEKEARKHRSQAKKNAKESKSFESILLAEKKARTKISPLQSIQTWMKNRKEIQVWHLRKKLADGFACYRIGHYQSNLCRVFGRGDLVNDPFVCSGEVWVIVYGNYI